MTSGDLRWRFKRSPIKTCTLVIKNGLMGHNPETIWLTWYVHTYLQKGGNSIFSHLGTYLQLTSCTSWEFIMFWKPIIFQNFWAMSFKNHWLTSYQNIYLNISFPKAVNKTCPCGVTIFTSRHKVITSSRSLQTRLLHQGVSRLLRHDDVDQSRNVSKSAEFRCEKNAFLLIGESWE